MAQRPWEVLRDKPITLSDAADFVHKALRDLRSTTTRSSVPCPPHLLDAINRLSTELNETLHDKKRRRVLEGLPRSSSKHRAAPYPSPSDSPASEASQCVFRKLVVRGLAQLMPLYLGNIEYGVKLFLSNFLMSFVPEFGGVWVIYRKVRSTDDRGFSYDAERLGVVVFRIDLEVLVFAPKQGFTLPAQVTEIRRDGLDALVLGSWMVNISSNRLLEGSVICQRKEGGAVVKVTDPKRPTSDPQKIERDSPIKFVVIRLQCTAGEGKDFFAIEGSLRAVKISATTRNAS